MFNNNFVYLADMKFTSIGPIYYEYGSMVITYEDASKAVRALYALREAKFDDKPLLGNISCILINIKSILILQGGRKCAYASRYNTTSRYKFVKHLNSMASASC